MMYLFIPTALQNEYLGLESKIIKSKIQGRICFTDEEQITFGGEGTSAGSIRRKLSADKHGDSK
ncbi:MAG: hypothetical protein ACYSYL_12490 [Planctomycetota bacterium]|jgi:hypothetical protein